MPMDRSEVARIVEANIGPLAAAMAVDRWRIRVEFGPCKNTEWAADCSRVVGYERAWINIDPEKHHTEADVIDSLRHELFHVVMAPWDVFRNAMIQHLEPGSSPDKQETYLWRHCVEQAVLNLERLWENAREYWEEQYTAPPKPEGAG